MPEISDRQIIAIEWAQPIRAVALDMDGLMVNTEELYTVVGETLLARRGKAFTRGLKDAMMGLPGPAAFAIMIQHEQLSDTVEALAEESAQVFAGLLPDRLRLLPGLLELLQLLDDRQLPRCVATSSSHRFAAEVLQRTEVFHRVDFVITAEDVVHGKPAPDIYLGAAERMGVAAPEMLVLEDSHHGAAAGVAAGACTVAVPGEHSAHFDFSAAAYVARSLADPALQRLLSGDD